LTLAMKALPKPKGGSVTELSVTGAQKPADDADSLALAGGGVCT